MTTIKLSSNMFRKFANHYLIRNSTINCVTYKRFYTGTFGTLNSFWNAHPNEHVNYSLVKPGDVTPPLAVPDNIPKPSYALSGEPETRTDKIDLKSDDAIDLMRKSCALAKKILNDASKHLKVGMSTDEIDVIVHRLCIDSQAYPSPLNYHGFPKSVCTSVNNVACHGIPDNRPLEDGDIITIDVSVFINNYHGDCAATYTIGNPDENSLKLMEVTKDCLYKAIDICGPGKPFSSIGRSIEMTAKSAGFNVVPCFCGHGIGTYFHGYPEILHYGNNMDGVMLERMTFTIEPVLSERGPNIWVLEDGWTAVTSDNSRTAQYEHTILITKSGSEILT